MTFSQVISQFVHNPVFMAPAMGWLSAQLIKIILYALIHHEFNPERMFGAGGMPSSHSATVCALATATAWKCGLSGPEFPITFFFAFIVMYDAMGVRRETGEQAKVLNELMLQWKNMGRTLQSRDPIKSFKELVGHTPLQVAVGALLGIVVATMMCKYLMP